MLEELVCGSDIVWTDKYPDPRAKNYWDLDAHRMFYIDDEIDDGILEIQKRIIEINYYDFGLDEKDRKPIVLVINSPGGYLQETFSLCDVILGSKTPVWTVNIGASMSGGFLLLIAGHKRFATPHSVAMVHSGSGGVSGTFEQTEAAQALYKKQVAQMRDFVLAHTTIEDKVFKRNQSKDWYMDADEQVKYGVVDQIITNLDDIVEAVA